MIFYFDETSTNLWEQRPRIWQPKQGLNLKLPVSQGRNVTIMGAISNYGHAITQIVDSTNAETVTEFMRNLAREFNLINAVIVLDNH